MEINKKFFDSIKPVLTQLKNKIGNDFVVFGSAPLYLMGVVDFDKPINDLDVAVMDKSVIPEDAKEIMFYEEDQKMYKLIIGDVEVDIGPLWKEQEGYFSRLFGNPIVVEGFKFANLDVVKEWKTKMVEKYNSEKDKIYLEKIEKYNKK